MSLSFSSPSDTVFRKRFDTSYIYAPSFSDISYTKLKSTSAFAILWFLLSVIYLCFQVCDNFFKLRNSRRLQNAAVHSCCAIFLAFLYKNIGRQRDDRYIVL